MHRSLRIPEIVDLIFAELRTPRQGNEGKDFATLARTCKAFQDPALNLLWSEQHTLDNLLRTLPPHLWTEKRHPGFSDNLRLTGPVEPADWEVPLMYALRIRTLRLWMWTRDADKLPVDIFEAISSGLPRDYLCPNLRIISWFADEDAIFPYIRLFLGPKITDVTITSGASSISLFPTLALR
ncbi:hypothetical protein DFH07DRAFT_823853 [Mycena maculata]|uniref:F-box domain-containing protein n=1 Tax=Mycena maculata TaxID=230809 RepID=A0AAD7NAH4_9AGAR|nr:hypothetical protein DFH07DRAFT_823853 [Mycena maculata]